MSTKALLVNHAHRIERKLRTKRILPTRDLRTACILIQRNTINRLCRANCGYFRAYVRAHRINTYTRITRTIQRNIMKTCRMFCHCPQGAQGISCSLTHYKCKSTRGIVRANESDGYFKVPESVLSTRERYMYSTDVTYVYGNCNMYGGYTCNIPGET